MLYLFMLLRIILMARILVDSLRFSSNRSQRICAMYGCKGGIYFTIKCLIKLKPFQTLFMALLASMLVFAFALRICERPLNQVSDLMDLSSYYNAIWCIAVTIATVGYGDYYPRTVPGRILCVIVCIWGGFIMSLMVVSLTNSLALDSTENKALSMILRLEYKERAKENAAQSITLFGKMVVHKMRKNKRKADNCIRDMRSFLNKFQMFWRMGESIDPVSPQEDLTTVVLGVREDIIDMKQRQKRVEDKLDRLLALLEDIKRNNQTLKVDSPKGRGSILASSPRSLNRGNPVTNSPGSLLKGLPKQQVLQRYILDNNLPYCCLLYTSPSPRDGLLSRMPSSA
eukprot:TRINITY_DN9000_c0_g1_i1.p1 TRINITY_DN9000_c0_g1~~TRINITY_DN9000_c0_g1_i1.p1  ORF type:complete len:342 (-),score=26.58 TRINITY_DN9000_c0_g1_i1:11-1036(-)